MQPKRRLAVALHVAAVMVALLLLLLLPSGADARGGSSGKHKAIADDEDSLYETVVFYGKVALGLSPIIGIGALAFCCRDAPEEEASRNAAKAHCST
jgi:hypothetical protein